MDAQNAVAAFRAYQHHLNVTEPGVTDFESSVVNNNINSSVSAATVHPPTNASNNYSLSQRINMMATIFANNNSQNNTVASTNANFPLLTSIASIPENTNQNPVLQQSAAVAAAALLSATVSNSNINAISNHFSPVAYQRSLNNSVAISAAAAAAALINLPSVVAASATNAVAEYVATQQPRTLQNLNQNVYPNNFVSYISSNIHNRSSNFSYSTSNNGSAALTHPYALISAPLCATSPNNHASCSLHQQNHNINRDVDLINNPFVVNSNHVVQPGNSQQLVPFLRTNLIAPQRNQRSSALTSSARSLKRSAAQISNSDDLFISNEGISNSQINHNSSYTLERTREINSVAETPLLSTVLISTQSRSENTDELSLRSRILTTSSSRVPKLRRIDSFDEEIVNTANLQTATTTIVQLQRQSEEGRNVIARMNIPSVVSEEENSHNPRPIPIARIYHSPNYSVHQYMAAIDASPLSLSENVLTAAYSTIPLLTNRSTVQIPGPQSFPCPVCRQSVVPQAPAAVITCNCVHHHCHHHHHAVCALCQQQQLIEQQSQNQHLTNMAAAFEQQNEQSNLQNNIPRSIHGMRLPNVLLNIAATLAQAQNQSRNIDALSHQQQMQNTLSNSHLHSQSHRREINPMHAAVLTNRFAHQEREQQSTALFYRQQQQNQISQQNQFQTQQSVITSPLIMVEDHPATEIMGLSMLLFRPNETTTLVLNGAGGTPATVVHQHAAAAVAASAAEQPIGTTIEQIKKNSSLFTYYKDPKIPEQERERCTVCLIEFETDDSLRSLNCSHLFHIECIDRWLLYNKKCPVCRVDMDKSTTPLAQTA